MAWQAPSLRLDNGGVPFGRQHGPRSRGPIAGSGGSRTSRWRPSRSSEISGATQPDRGQQVPFSRSPRSAVVGLDGPNGAIRGLPAVLPKMRADLRAGSTSGSPTGPCTPPGRASGRSRIRGWPKLRGVQHRTRIDHQPAGSGAAKEYYFTCSCGAGGPWQRPWRKRKREAQEDARRHREKPGIGPHYADVPNRQVVL